MIKNCNKQQGFSLLEVLVAFSIFAMSLGVIFQIYSTGSRSMILSDEYARAVIIAQSKLASIGIEETQTFSESSGIEDKKFLWITRISPLEENDYSDLENSFNLIQRHVEVEINWDSLNKSRTLKLNTIKLIPTT